MRVVVQSSSVPVTQALRSFAEQQVNRLVRKSQRIYQINFGIRKILGKKNDMTAAEVTCRVSLPGKQVVITRRGSDVYEALVDSSRRAARKLRKLREKRSQKYRKFVTKRTERWHEAWDLDSMLSKPKLHS